MKISPWGRRVGVAMLGLLGVAGCSVKKPAKESAAPTVLEPYDRLTRVTYEKFLQCGKSSWFTTSRTIVFSKEGRGHRGSDPSGFRPLGSLSGHTGTEARDAK
jgi:hypothetical protein